MTGLPLRDAREPVAASLWMSALLLMMVVLPASAQEGEAIEFRFQPEDGAVWIREMTDRQVKDYGSAAPGVEQITNASVKYRYVRGEGDHWSVLQTPLTATLSVNGEVLPNPALELSMGHLLTVRLNDQGFAENVDGFRDLVRKFERNLEPKLYARVRQFTSRSMEAQQVQEWNEPLRDLLGQTVHLGERWKVLDEYSMGNKKLSLTGVLRFTSWIEVAGYRGVKVEYFFDTTGEALSGAGTEFNRTLDRRQTESGPSNVVLHGALIRVLNPETGQLLHETYDVEYEVPLGTTDGPTARFVESHVFKYTRSEG